MIYFAQDPASCNIKIGFTANDDVEQRLKSLQTGCPSPLILIAVMEGDYEREQRLHRELAEHCVHGEWFRPSAPVMAIIARMAQCVVPKPSWSPLKDPRERRFADELIRLLVTHGHMAFSLQGPLSGVIDGLIKGIAQQIFEHSGSEGMRRVFESIEEWATAEYSELHALCVCGALDHRFDSIGGWWA